MNQKTRILLAHLKEKDLNNLWSFASNPKVTRYLTWKAYSQKSTLKEFLHAAMKKKEFPDEALGIYLNKKLIGTIHAISRDGNKIQFGYGLSEKYWGKGYATKACLLAIKRIKKNWFKKMKYKKVELWADINEANSKGKTIALILGFKLIKKSIEPKRDRYSLIISKD